MKESQDPRKSLEALIEHFDQNLYTIKSPQYNETQVRQEFINPFFSLLGWDMDNRQGYAEAYKDVIHEDAIKVGGYTKAPDYCFRIGGMRKFFVEAKKPSVNIKDDPEPAYQLRRYAWSAKLPLSILTDFQELAVYDCRSKPGPADKPSVGRVQYIGYRDYLDKWDDIASVFSRDAVLKGSFDKYAESEKAKRGTTEVDKAFLQEIEAWRDSLARNMALRNAALSSNELNFAVQSTIDRIIFLRICEDRGIEDYARLMAIINGDGVYKRLMGLFRAADDRYNSGLFHFGAEKGRGEGPDELTPHLVVDDKVLKDILKSLYYPESPYEFSVLPADILGQVYEQFLGKVIRLTAGHQAKVEDKPEVKKAGGVYYTPTYIVEYIVKNTVGKMLEGKTPREVSGVGAIHESPLRILDPACGSGSFLLGAYQYLLTWYRDRYVEEGAQKWAKGKEPRLYQASGGEWKLTTSERKRILLSHIYGVDIDTQAVEVTKLSLLLKVLEGETKESVSYQRKLFQERALPDLSRNIKCGNSLIGSDFYKGQQPELFGEEERARINAFDWEEEFPEVFHRREIRGGKNKSKAIATEGTEKGFDVVIGNPPYIRIQALKEWAPLEVEHYKAVYQSASKGNYDIYVVFVERGLSLLNERGRLGYILPHKFFTAQYGAALREIIAKSKNLAEIVHFGDHQVFVGATTYTALFFLEKMGSDNCRFIMVNDLSTWRSTGQAVGGVLPASRISATEWNFVIGTGSELFEKLSAMPMKLGDVAHLFVGLQTDADDVFILEEILRDKGRVLCKSKSTDRTHWFENNHLKPFLKGSLNIRRYYLSDVNKRLIFPYELEEGKSVLLEASKYSQHYPLTWAYLLENRERLSARNKGRIGKEWYGYVYKKNHALYGVPKLLVPSIATGSCFASDLDGVYYFVGSGGGGGGGYGITLGEKPNDLYLYLLGLLNSSLLSKYLKTISTSFRGGYIALNRQYIEQLPIRLIDFSSPSEKSRNDQMVSLVSHTAVRL